MDRLAWIPIIIVWVIVGFILFLPYAWLAGGVHDTTLSTVMMLVAPAVILALVVLISGVREFSTSRKEKRQFLTAFWILLTIINLPIVMRFTSIGLRALNYVSVADFIFKYRFQSILMAVVVVILVIMIRTYKLFEKLGKQRRFQN